MVFFKIQILSILRINWKENYRPLPSPSKTSLINSWSGQRTEVSDTMRLPSGRISTSLKSVTLKLSSNGKTRSAFAGRDLRWKEFCDTKTAGKEKEQQLTGVQVDFENAKVGVSHVEEFLRWVEAHAKRSTACPHRGWKSKQLFLNFWLGDVLQTTCVVQHFSPVIGQILFLTFVWDGMSEIVWNSFLAKMSFILRCWLA